jgi:hypothetical protein
MDIRELIRRRRGQMLVHSCIYYDMNDNIISDDQWQAWAEELHQLQTQFPEHCKIGYFDWEFRDWDGTTGAHLPHRHPDVYRTAELLLKNNSIDNR